MNRAERLRDACTNQRPAWTRPLRRCHPFSPASPTLTRTALASAVPSLLAPTYLICRLWLIPTGRFPGLIITAIAGRHLRRALTATQQCSPDLSRKGPP